MARIAVASQAPVISYAVTLPNGVRIHSAQQGPATGPALVLLHGFSDSSFSFSRIMPLLPAQLRVIAPDLRGHGDSSRPATGYGVADFADDVLQLMNTLNVPSAIVAGHSMGSFVAQALTERASNRVTHQVLVASAPDAVNDSTRELCSFVETLFDPINPDFVRGFQHGTVSKPVPQTFMDLAMATSQRMPAHIWKEAFRGLMNFKPRSPRPDVPTLVMGGVEDPVFSVAEQIELASQFERSQLRLFEGVGHALHWEQPEAFVEELLKIVPGT